MLTFLGHSTLLPVVLTLLELATIARILLRPHREPASRLAWAMAVGVLPVLGLLAYLLLGEVRLGRRRLARRTAVVARLPPPAALDNTAGFAAVPARYHPLFRLGQSISGFAPVAGNRASLPADSNAMIDALVADIEAAREHVHLLFFIWLTDRNGTRVAEALARAAKRGVVCRAMADDLGSRALIRSPQWQALRAAGVQVAAGLPIGNPLLRVLFGRLDLRNHRKIAVIDDRIAYCGSQNCADPKFRVKAKYAPWVDAVLRFEGPIARQKQLLFARDWMSDVAEDLTPLLDCPVAASFESGFPAQVIASGPTLRYSAMPELFVALLNAARREATITTPYYVPDETLQSALRSAAYRGVAVTLILPARNDSWVVAAASRSYYAELLAAGVKLYEYRGGLLHAKTFTLDGEVALIGSANMDRRSFELNYENNVLLYDPTTTAALRRRQQSYLAQAEPVSAEEVAAWSIGRRLWNNAVATLGPVL